MGINSLKISDLKVIGFGIHYLFFVTISDSYNNELDSCLNGCLR